MRDISTYRHKISFHHATFVPSYKRVTNEYYNATREQVLHIYGGRRREKRSDAIKLACARPYQTEVVFTKCACLLSSRHSHAPAREGIFVSPSPYNA